MSATTNSAVTKRPKVNNRKLLQELGRQAALQWAENRSLEEINQAFSILQCGDSPELQFTDDAKALFETVTKVSEDYADGFLYAVSSVRSVREEIFDHLYRAESMSDGIRWAKELCSSDQLSRICRFVEESSSPAFQCLPTLSNEWPSRAQYLTSIVLEATPKTNRLNQHSIDWKVCWNLWQPFIDPAGKMSPQSDDEIAEKLRRFDDYRYANAFVVGVYVFARQLTPSRNS
jgi:hypothetical protein